MKLLLIIIASVLTPTTYADIKIAEKLFALLLAQPQWEAQFEQESEGIVSEELYLKKQHGKIIVSMPNKLYWETKAPWAQILLVVDNHAQIYDPDLMQVTDIDLSQQPLPILTALLLGGGARTQFFLQHYSITQLGDQHFRLIAKLDANPRQVDVYFKQRFLDKLIIIDSLQQTTQLSLSKQKNTLTDKEVFNWQAPENAIRAKQL